MSEFTNCTHGKKIKEERSTNQGVVIKWREDIRPSGRAQFAITVGSTVVANCSMSDQEAHTAFIVAFNTANI